MNLTNQTKKEMADFEDQLINAADFLYRHNMRFANENRQYELLIKNGFCDDVAVIAIEDFNE